MPGRPVPIDLRSLLTSLAVILSSALPAAADPLSVNTLFQLDGYHGDNPSDAPRTDIRRARIGVSSRLTDSFTATAGFEYGSGEIVWENAFLAWTPQPHLSLFAGHIEAPLSFEDETSDAAATFLERASLNNLTFGRSLGFGARWADDYIRFETSVTGEPGTNSAFGDDKALRLAVRTDIFDMNGDSGWFLGASYGHEERGLAQPVISALGAELAPLESRAVPAGLYFDQSRYRGVEAFVQTGPVSISGEYAVRNFNMNGTTSARQDAAYIKIAWFLTGEMHQRDMMEGRLIGITPLSRFGAVEAAARISQSHLRVPVFETRTSYTLGLNWYLGRRDRLMLNLVHDAPDYGPSETSIGLRWQTAITLF